MAGPVLRTTASARKDTSGLTVDNVRNLSNSFVANNVTECPFPFSQSVRAYPELLAKLVDSHWKR